MILDIISTLLCLYVAYESAEPLGDMPKGLELFCQKLKYAAAFGSAIGIMYTLWYVILNQVLPAQYLNYFEWFIFGVAGTLSSFVWPRTVHALGDWLDDFASAFYLDESWDD